MIVNTMLRLMLLLMCVCLTACSTTAPQKKVARSSSKTPVTLLTSATRSSDPLLRANAIEMMQPAIEPLRAAVQRGLVDPNTGVRFVSAMALGRQKLCGIAGSARPLLDDPSPSVRAAAMFALESCGGEIDLSPLASMVLSEDRTVRANAAMVLGEIGQPSAAIILREAMKRPLPLEEAEVVRANELGVAEALVRLGDRRQLDTIRAAFFAPAAQGELTALAAQMAGRLNDRTLIPALAALALADGPRQAGPELRLIAAEALGRMDPEMVLTGLAISFHTHPLPEVRMQAAAVLAWDRTPEGRAALSDLMADQAPRVRIAAAGALLRRTAGR